jgi:hypothetical protein
MKQHLFVIVDKDFGMSSDDYCEECGMTWEEISSQMMEEAGGSCELSNELESDDCDIRRRKNAMKAFW